MKPTIAMTQPTPEAQALDQLCINTIRALALDAVQQANSGHPGLPLGCAPMAYVLWTRLLRHNPNNPQWFNRDRFLLSAGHGSMLLYALLHLTGYGLELEELKNFRQYGSRTPGHPENTHTPGVEITTGPLGQGFANGVGMAMAARHLAAKYNREGFPLVDHYIYGIVSDGDLMEGVAAEAASMAGHLQLGNLIYLYDDNEITIDGATSLAFTENVPARFAAYGWHTQTVADGNDLDAIEAALRAAQAVTGKPSLIAVKTTIGYGMPSAGTNQAHSDAPGAEAVRATKKALGWPEDAQFYIPEAALAHFRAAQTHGAEREAAWNALLETYAAAHPELAQEFKLIQTGALPENWEQHLPDFAEAPAAATRAHSGQVLNALAPHIPQLIGGSADLSGSNNTTIKDSDKFQPANYAGRVIHFGVREHAMGAALVGMNLHSRLIPFGGTFMTFSDYCKPAIRLAAISRAQAIFVFTHDSIGVGEDGPTHQPIEHLAMLRAIPNLYVIRPADAHETREAWRIAIQRRGGPTALTLTRQKLPPIDRAHYAPAEMAQRGGYILAEAVNSNMQPTRPALILLATGSEVSLALQAREQLQAHGTATRVVSLPCWELFDEQPADYRAAVLPPTVTARLAIEAGASFGWQRYTGLRGASVTLERFGASAPAETVFRAFGFSVENIVARAKSLG
jgi:transketolase